MNVAPQRRRKVSISAPRSLTPSSPSFPKRPRAQCPRVTRSRSRSQLLLPHKSSATQTLTLTSATSFSTQAKDIEDIDINTISFPPPPSPPRPRSSSRTRRPLTPSSRSVSPAPQPRGGNGPSFPPHPVMGRGRGIAVHPPARAGLNVNPRIRLSTSPPSAGTPPIPKRARLTSGRRSSRAAKAVVEQASIPERPGSPTPGSGPSSSTTSNLNDKKVWITVSTSSPPPPVAASYVSISEDDDDDIIVFRMDVEHPMSRPSSPVEQASDPMEDVEAVCDIAVAAEAHFQSFVDLPPPPYIALEDPMLEDAREDMQRQSLLLAKRVRKRMNPSLPDGSYFSIIACSLLTQFRLIDSPPPTPSPIRLRQAIATMFLEQSNSFPPMRRPPPPGLDGRGRRSALCIEVHSDVVDQAVSV